MPIIRVIIKFRVSRANSTPDSEPKARGPGKVLPTMQRDLGIWGNRRLIRFIRVSDGGTAAKPRVLRPRRGALRLSVLFSDRLPSKRPFKILSPSPHRAGLAQSGRLAFEAWNFYQMFKPKSKRHVGT
jgi:hypothetical protein